VDPGGTRGAEEKRERGKEEDEGNSGATCSGRCGRLRLIKEALEMVLRTCAVDTGTHTSA